MDTPNLPSVTPIISLKPTSTPKPTTIVSPTPVPSLPGGIPSFLFVILCLFGVLFLCSTTYCIFCGRCYRLRGLVLERCRRQKNCVDGEEDNCRQEPPFHARQQSSSRSPSPIPLFLNISQPRVAPSMSTRSSIMTESDPTPVPRVDTVPPRVFQPRSAGWNNINKARSRASQGDCNWWARFLKALYNDQLDHRRTTEISEYFNRGSTTTRGDTASTCSTITPRMDIPLTMSLLPCTISNVPPSFSSFQSLASTNTWRTPLTTTHFANPLDSIHSVITSNSVPPTEHSHPVSTLNTFSQLSPASTMHPAPNSHANSLRKHNVGVEVSPPHPELFTEPQAITVPGVLLPLFVTTKDLPPPPLLSYAPPLSALDHTMPVTTITRPTTNTPRRALLPSDTPPMPHPEHPALPIVPGKGLHPM